MAALGTAGSEGQQYPAPPSEPDRLASVKTPIAWACLTGAPLQPVRMDGRIRHEFIDALSTAELLPQAVEIVAKSTIKLELERVGGNVTASGDEGERKQWRGTISKSTIKLRRVDKQERRPSSIFSVILEECLIAKEHEYGVSTTSL